MRPYGEGRFNSRAPRGARPRNRCRRNTVFSFNSRAPRGARRLYSVTPIQAFLFQFTCPSRSTTDGRSNDRVMHSVSIHVPLAEHEFTCPSRSTTRPFHQMPGQYSFNSRAPRGARPSILTSAPVVRMFQFTCPSRSTTAPLGD